MSSKKFSALGFSEKLSLVNRTSESIHNIAQWILEHKNHCFEITNEWLKAVEKADVTHRVTLFYVANDVVQQCKKQDASRYREAFANTLELAMHFANDESIKYKIERLVTIWEERGIYHPDFLRGLTEKLNAKKPEVEQRRSPSPVNLSDSAQFKVNLNSALQELKKMSAAVRKQRLLEGIENLDIDINSIPSIGQAQGAEILRRLNPRIANATAYISTVDKETDQRKAVIRELEKTDKFYTQQLSDVRTVAKAYKAFGRKLKRVQKCLAERKALFTLPGAKASISSSSSGLLTQKEAIVSSPNEVSTLEKRLSLLTQGIGVQGFGCESMKLDYSSPPGNPAVKSPQNSISEGHKHSPAESHSACEGHKHSPAESHSACEGHKHSPAESHSACEGHKICGISPPQKEEVDSSHVDIDPFTPGLGKVRVSPKSLNSSPAHVQVIDLINDKFPEKGNQPVHQPKENSPARPDLCSEPHLQSFELPEGKAPFREDLGNHCTAPSKCLCKAKSSTEETSAVKISTCKQDDTSQAHSPISPGSKCMPVTSSQNDVAIILHPDSSEAQKENSPSDSHKESHVCGGNLMESISPSQSTSSVMPDITKSSNSVFCVNHEEDKEVKETAQTSLSSELEPKKGLSEEDEVVILSENAKVLPKKHSILEKNNCSPQLMYNILQSVVAYAHISPGNPRKPPERRPGHVRDIINLYSLLLRTPSNCCSCLKKKTGECEVITVLDEHRETAGNCNKIQNHLPASAVKVPEVGATANLEVMDMDLGSSDDETA